MISRSHVLRVAASIVAFLFIYACSDNRAVPLSEVVIVDIPVADLDETPTNVNISNPTLDIPETFEVSPGDELTLVWSDEFDGAQLDPEVWFFATGDGTEKGLPGGWGNAELQYYLPDNAMLVNGALEITARREIAGNQNYTSARINTEDRFAFKYGRIEASIKLPAGQGIWPAFWMLSQDSQYQCNGRPCNWAATGEIDIMEAINLGGTGGNEIYGTLHYGGESPANVFTGSTFSPGVNVTEDFHTYAIEWDEFEIRWYFDGQLYAMQNSWYSTAAPYPAPFNQPFHILLNVAVGGNFPGSPNGTTQFPVTMAVDWVRVYSGEESSGPTADRGIFPDAVILSSDPGVAADFIFGTDYQSFEAFGSGATFFDAGDSDFAYSLGITSGNGYGAEIAQFAIAGFDPGFASSYATLDFKAKGLNNNVIRVKFLDDGAYINVVLTGSPYSTALGNGWYQVSLPLSLMAGVSTSTTLLFETDNSAPAPFTFYLTDVGFSGTAGGGSGVEGAELVVNGDFESGDLAGWQTFNNSGTIAVSSPGSNGGFGVNIDASGNTKNPTLKQSNLGAGQLSPNQQVAVSFDWKGAAAVGGVVDIVLFSESTTGGITQTDSIVSGGTIPADWASVGPIIFNTASDVTGGVTLQITVICGGDDTCVSNLFLDNISIIAVGLEPGTGGGGTGGTVLATFDEVTPPAVTPFGGAATVIETGPAGGDGSNVLNIVRNGGEVYAGAWIAIPTIPSDAGSQTVSAEVYSPTAGIPMVAKAEYGDNLGTGDVQANETVVAGWQTLTWTFTNLDSAQVYNRFVILPNLGTVDTTTSYFFDNITLLAGSGGGGGGGSAAGDIAVNGGFETGDFSGWVTFPNGGIQSITTTNPSSGTFAANLTVPVRAANDPAVDNLIKNANLEAGNLTPGASVTVSFDMRGSLSGAGGVVFAEFFSELSGGGTSKAEIFTGNPLTPTTGWTNYVFTTTLGPDVSGGATLQLKASCGPVEGCGVDVFFDNVSIVVQ